MVLLAGTTSEKTSKGTLSAEVNPALTKTSAQSLCWASKSYSTQGICYLRFAHSMYAARAYHSELINLYNFTIVFIDFFVIINFVQHIIKVQDV